MRRILGVISTLGALVALAPAAAAGVDSSNPGGDWGLVKVGDTIFFEANDGVHGYELWKSDGTEGGTVLVKAVNPANPGICPCGLIRVGSQVFYGATDGVHGHELWKSDGTANGTAMVEDITPGEGGTGLHILGAVGSELYFAVENGYGLAMTLWKSDGTEEGTGSVAPIGLYVLDDVSGVALGSSLYFLSDDGVHGIELWTSDGTSDGTGMVVDLNPGPAEGVVDELLVWGSELYFGADDGEHGMELWTSDGTPEGTRMLKNINRGAQSSSPTGLTAFGELILFSANDGTTSGAELWKSDGSRAGTVLVKDITPGGHRKSVPRAVTPIGKRALFAGLSYGSALYRTDGTAEGTHIVRRPRNGGPTRFGPQLERVEGIGVLFEAAVSSLWRSNGWRNGTFEVLDVSPAHITALGTGTALFSGDDGVNGRELWITDGTPSGTQLVADIYP